ncbi:MAG TPA: hypothetical protein VNQ81_03215 [Povalibacter sp.]|nr:hypothetical protein [Povalibacter sp.]
MPLLRLAKLHRLPVKLRAMLLKPLVMRSTPLATPLRMLLLMLPTLLARPLPPPAMLLPMPLLPLRTLLIPSSNR